MKIQFLASILLCSALVSASASACFDPRTAFIKCEKGTEFNGWNKGNCPGIQVQGAICAPISHCFDPRVVRIACEKGTEFKGWNKGNCAGILVKNAICE